MSAELLRRAATRARELADYAPDAPWAADVRDDGRAWVDVANEDDHAWSMHGLPAAALHVASWDPAVARAVADLLDSGADEIERRVARYGEEILERANHVFDAMIALARTYLDEVA